MATTMRAWASRAGSAVKRTADRIFDPITSTFEIYVKDDMTKSLDDVLDTMQANIADLQGGGSVPPLMTVPMHLGRLDNNSGAEIATTTRICSDAIPVEAGKTYWLTNAKGVNMYALLYDVDEVYLGLKGNIPSGAPIEVTEEGAAYIKFSSTVGEYDLSNVFLLYDTDPASTPEEPGAGYSKEEADKRFALAVHTHTAGEVAFADGETFQQKLDSGALKGEPGEQGPTGPAGVADIRVQNGIVQYLDNGTWKNAKSIWG